MNKIGIRIGTVILTFLLSYPLMSMAQPHCVRKLTKETQSWLQRLYQAAKEHKPYYSQFDQYPARNQRTLQSTYARKTGVDLFIYGLDFYYASGTWFTSSYKEKCRNNLVAIVKEAWHKHKAIPCFSWHLENPYVPTGFNNYMGCRYRYSVDGYPASHRYVVKEILEEKGDSCGFGSYGKQNNPKGYKNPAEWFDARCREVAGIIRELKDKDGRPIPIIFRLWHECEDSWQWWGKSHVSPEDYIRFFQLTVDKIEKYTQTHNVLYAYSPDRYWKDEQNFMLRYPGDNYVELIGFDDYSIGSDSVALQATILRAKTVSKLAEQHQKVAALFETANSKKATSDRFFRDFLQPIIEAVGVEFGLVQLWSTGKLNTPEEITDRTLFLKSGIVKIIDK